jgi:hypothetical protein
MKNSIRAGFFTDNLISAIAKYFSSPDGADIYNKIETMVKQSTPAKRSGKKQVSFNPPLNTDLVTDRFGQTEICPICNTNWFDGVREEDGLRCLRLIGIYDIDLDKTVEWQCPDCRTRWTRAGKYIGK